MRDTLVIGAGAIGLACARSLSHRGVDVAIVERGAPGEGCSAGNAGWIVPTLSGPLPAPGLGFWALRRLLAADSPLRIAPRYVPALATWLRRFWRHCNPAAHQRGLEAMAGLARNTMELFDELEREAPFLEMHRAGLLFLFLDEAAMRREQQELEFWTEHGYEPPEVLDGEGARRIEPGVSDGVNAALMVRQERHVRPESLTSAYVQSLRRASVEIRCGVEVFGGAKLRRRLIDLDTSRGRLEARRYVLAAGAWTAPLAGWLGSSLPIEAGRGYSLTIDAPRTRVRTPLYLGEARVGCTPFAGALRLAGILEFSGCGDSWEPSRIGALRRAAESYLRRVPTSPGREWMGMRPFAPDGLPMIGRLPGYDNVWVAGAHGLAGITLAPATGELLADLITESDPGIDAAPFDPGRFTRRRGDRR